MTDRSRDIIGAAIDVHTAIGPGLLESAYQECMAHELTLRDIKFVRELPLHVIYKGVRVDCAYRADFVVDGTLLEIKSVAAVEPIHVAQTLTYMKIGGWQLGLLINFNVVSLNRGIKRLFLTSSPSSPLR